jgi:hypothetical protein
MSSFVGVNTIGGIARWPIPTSRKNRIRLAERDYSHRTLIEKLGIKPDHRVCLRGISDVAFTNLVTSSVDTTPAQSARGRYDIIIAEVNAPKDLASIRALAEHLEPSAGLWILHPKGKGASPNDADVRAAGLAAGLVDNKVSAYSGTHTAIRFVIPRERRGMLKASKSRG